MTKKGHLPIRTCVGCRKKREKKEMIRFVQSSERQADPSQKETPSGRGFYLCPDLNCLKLAKKRFPFLNMTSTQNPFQKGFPQKGEG